VCHTSGDTSTQVLFLLKCTCINFCCSNFHLSMTEFEGACHYFFCVLDYCALLFCALDYFPGIDQKPKITKLIYRSAQTQA
jgi:hypothetical protein